MKKFVLLILVFSLFLVFLPAEQSYAQTTSASENSCTCFCKSDQGAKNLKKVSDRITCSTKCEAEGNKLLGCYKKEKDFPISNTLCWTKDSCLNYEILDAAGDNIGTTWGRQRPECPKNMGYCYANPIEIQLGTAINNISSVTSIGAYIQLIYAFLIPASALIAIVIMMIGGMQYMLARGNASKITEAKKRISNALIGVVLVLSAYTIANFIDPNLVSFDALKTPLIKGVTFLDQGSRCEYLSTNGAEIKKLPSNKEGVNAGMCGTRGEITSLDGLPESVTTSLEVGDKCIYSACAKPGERSFATCVVSNNDYSCRRCANVYNPLGGVGSVGTGLGGLNPSAQTCANVLNQDSNNALRDESDFHTYCGYDPDAFNFTGRASCFEVRYPHDQRTDYGRTYLDCNRLRDDLAFIINRLPVGTKVNRCTGYNQLLAIYGLGTGVATVFGGNASSNIEMLNDFEVYEFGRKQFFENLCTNDPCNLAPEVGCKVEVKTVQDHSISGNFWNGVSAITLGYAEGVGTLRYFCTNTEGVALTAEEKNTCSFCEPDCGAGALNYCDEAECEAIGDCVFTDTLGFGGTCAADPDICK